jgi:MFS family permease
LPERSRGCSLDPKGMRWKSRLVRARLSLGLVTTLFLGLLVILHFLEPEFNSEHLISEYQLGSHGWIMSLAFCTFGIGVVVLALISHGSTRNGRLGQRGLWLIGVALFAAGLFPPIPTRLVVVYVHGVSGLVVILASPIVFVLVSRSLAVPRETQLWDSTRPSASATG